MQPNNLDAGQRAALRRLQRAQLAEARRIRQVVADGYTLTPAHLRCPLSTRTTAFPYTRIGRLLGGRDHATVLHGVAVIASRLTSSREEDVSLRHMVCGLAAMLDDSYDGAGEDTTAWRAA